MSPRCLSTLIDLPQEGYSGKAFVRLSQRRKFPHRLGITRADIPQIRADVAGSMSISGVQDKISLRLNRGRLEPVNTGGEYILKPIPGTVFPVLHDDVPANEHITMQLAEQLFGIRCAANALIRLADGELAYVTRRFDRTRDGGRIAQEDFCQLMQRSPNTHGQNYKYESSYEAIGTTLKHYCAAYAVEVEELFRRVVFSYATRNGDAHLKNFSLQQGKSGDYRLTPAYDLVSSSLHFPKESRLALDLYEGELPAGVANEGYETGRDFLELARRYGIRERRAAAIVEGVAERRDAVHDLVSRSFLTKAAKGSYVAGFDDRLKALAA